MFSPGRLLGRFGLAARHRRRTLPRIEAWQGSVEDAGPSIPVHVLAGKGDWQMAAWALASWFQASERSWPVTVHDDGTLPTEARKILPKLFPKLRLISRAESDDEMDSILKPFPFCYEFRGLHPRGMRLFDVTHYCKDGRFILLDPDVLFFNYPRALLDWVDGKTAGSWFLLDAQENALITAQEAKEEMEVELWKKVNTGLGLVEREIVNFDFCDRVLAETSILRGAIERAEPTLYALLAGKKGSGGQLPKEYAIADRKPIAADVVARRYPDPAREQFFGEGLERLHALLLPGRNT